MGRIVLMRHGRTYGNEAGRLDTKPPGAELTPEGREGAAAAGALLAELAPGVRKAYSSIAIRAQQSMVACANTFEQVTGRALELEVVCGLHEVFAGDFENSNDPEALRCFREVMEQWMSGNRDAHVPGGESAAQVLDRVLPILQELAQADEDILVVCHGGIMRLVGIFCAGVPVEHVLEHPVANSTFVIVDEQFQCHYWVDGPFGQA